MGGTFTMNHTIPAYRRWWKPWTWFNKPQTVSTNPIPYDAPPSVIQYELYNLGKTSPLTEMRQVCNPIFAQRQDDGSTIITFRGGE